MRPKMATSPCRDSETPNPASGIFRLAPDWLRGTDNPLAALARGYTGVRNGFDPPNSRNTYFCGSERI